MCGDKLALPFILFGLLVFTACGDEPTGPSTGTLRVTTSTTGSDLDPDGYSCSVDGYSGAIGVNETVMWGELEPGEHAVELTDLAGNCVVSGPNPRHVTVIAGQSTATVFNVSCSMLMGALQVTAVTDGDTLDADGYTLTLNDTTSEPIAIDGSLTFSGLVPGSHSIELSDVQVNCEVVDANPQAVTVRAEDTTRVAFGVSCAAALFDHIAFVSYRDLGQSGEVYIMNADGSNPRRLTHYDKYDWEPAWSPDGTRIAFLSNRDGYSDIYIMNVDGSNFRNLTNSLALDSHPAWSPDGTKIAFRSNLGGPSDIYVMEVDGSVPRNLTRELSGAWYPAWSPDGTRIAFSRFLDGQNDLYLMDADGADPRNLTSHLAADLYPSWSPDGAKIAFTSNRDGSYDIWVMNADGSDPENLTENELVDVFPAWSPDGTRIAFSRYLEKGYDVFVMDADGANLENLTRKRRDDTNASWSPTR